MSHAVSILPATAGLVSILPATAGLVSILPAVPLEIVYPKAAQCSCPSKTYDDKISHQRSLRGGCAMTCVVYPLGPAHHVLVEHANYPTRIQAEVHGDVEQCM